MALSRPRLLGERHIVRFAGFESDTWTLQQEGWSFSAEQDFQHDTIRLAMHHSGCGLYALAQQQTYYFQEAGYREIYASREPLVFDVRHCSSKIMVNVQARSFNFQAIDVMPQFTEAPIRRIEDFGIFAPALVRTEEIIIEPQSVAECLELIRKMQAPELAAIRKRNTQRDFMAPGQQQTFHAQILSLAA